MRLLIVAWEAGAAAALAPVVQQAINRKDDCYLFCWSPAREILSKRLTPAPINLTEVESDFDWDVTVAGVGGPSRRDCVESWREINRRRPSICVLDHWKGLDRFRGDDGALDTGILPDRVAVIDESVLNALAKRGVHRDRIVVTGQPQLEQLEKLTFPNGLIKALREKLELKPEQRVHVLASERLHDFPLHIGSKDGGKSLAVADVSGRPLWQVLLEETSAERNNSVLVMRPHPIETGPNPTSLRMVDSNEVSDVDLLSVADRVYGISSMLLIQAVCRGIKSVNVASRLDSWECSQSYLDVDVWGNICGSYWPDDSGNHPDCPPTHSGAVENVLNIVDSLHIR